MDKIDKLIHEALSEEERELLQDFEEQDFFSQSFGLLQGRNGWVAAVMLAMQTVMFIAAVWCGWHFYTATEMLAALKWGLSAVALVVLATQIKLALMPQIQADRLLRALRRLELMLVQNRT